MRQAIIQMGYVTRDLDAALDYWINAIKAGPFYFAEYEPEQQVYRGKPTHTRFRLAYGFSGDMNVEVVQQLSGGPSAYTEALDAAGEIPTGGLFHHVMVTHNGYDEAYNAYLAQGAERCFDAVAPGVLRYSYLDARKLMGSYLEMLEDASPFLAGCEKMREIHRSWDGTRPKRDFGEIIELL
jgi:hypothetical protein